MTTVMMFAEEMPKEVDCCQQNDKISLSTNNELLYEGKLYTGKIVFNGVAYDNGFINLKDGHLEGKIFLETEVLKVAFDVVNGEFDGYFVERSTIFEVDSSIILNFKNGKIETNISFIGLKGYNLTFDSSGNANGTVNDNKTGKFLICEDGIEKVGNDFVLKINNGDKGNEQIFSMFDKEGKLIYESGRGNHMNRDAAEKIVFQKMVR